MLVIYVPLVQSRTVNVSEEDIATGKTRLTVDSGGVIWSIEKSKLVASIVIDKADGIASHMKWWCGGNIQDYFEIRPHYSTKTGIVYLITVKDHTIDHSEVSMVGGVCFGIPYEGMFTNLVTNGYENPFETGSLKVNMIDSKIVNRYEQLTGRILSEFSIEVGELSVAQ